MFESRCPHCHELFEPSRISHIYCTPTCRVEAYRKSNNLQRVATLDLLYRIRAAAAQGAALTELLRESQDLEKHGPKVKPTFTAWLWGRWERNDTSTDVARFYARHTWPDNGYATRDKFAEAVEAIGRMCSHGGDWSEAIAQAGELWRADTGRAELAEARNADR